MKRYHHAVYVSLLAAIAAFIGVSTSAPIPVAAQLNTHSHLRVTSSVPDGGSSVDPVINNQIQVEITIKETGGINDQDAGTLILYPTNPPAYGWNCHECDDNFFASAPVACATLDGCDNNDVREWIVGVTVNRAGPPDPDLVVYDIDSSNLGNGSRFDSGPDCSDAVAPVTDTYSQTDVKASWDVSTLCSNNGVTINLDYQ